MSGLRISDSGKRSTKERSLTRAGATVLAPGLQRTTGRDLYEYPKKRDELSVVEKQREEI